MDLGIFIPIGNNGWMMSANSPQYMPSFALNHAIAGMILGQRIRQRLSESLFRKLCFISLLALGGYIITSALGVFQ